MKFVTITRQDDTYYGLDKRGWVWWWAPKVRTWLIFSMDPDDEPNSEN